MRYYTKRKIRPIEERFWEKVQKTDACWLWTGRLTKGKYGSFYVTDREIYVHRYSYELHFGSIPDGLDICHSCDVPNCVNPSHLFAATHRENMADKERKHRGNQPYGEKSGQSKLTQAQVKEIRQKYAEGVSQTELSKIYPVSQVQIFNIVNNKAWVHYTE